MAQTGQGNSADLPPVPGSITQPNGGNGVPPPAPNSLDPSVLTTEGGGDQAGKVYKGGASLYDLPGRGTASGAPFDGTKMAAAMTGEKVKLGQSVEVTYTFKDASGNTVTKTISVVVNDHGPFAVNERGKAIHPLRPHPQRVIDLTPTAFRALTGNLRLGVVEVIVTVPK